MPGGLTEKTIKSLKARQGEQYVAWDADLKGFGVRVNPHGTKTYILKYRLPSGRVRWATIGRVGAVAIDRARRDARHMVGIVAGGQDPLRSKDVSRNAPTLGEVADLFLEEHVEARRKPSTVRLYTLAVDSHIRPRIGAIAITDVAPADVLKLHHGLRATPYLANRVLAVASKLLSWAEQRGYRPANSNPAMGIEKFKEEARRRYLTSQELARVGAALRVGEQRLAIPLSSVTAIRLLMLTGARVGEILSLRWRDVDLSGAALHLPDSKTGRKTILLSPPALDVLKGWPRFAKNPYVFPAEGKDKRKGTHRVDLKGPWAWVRRRARISDVRLHDLRHTFASVAVSSGQTLPVIGALLGHSQPATTARYSHLFEDPLRAASNATAAPIAAAIGSRRRE